MRQNKGFISFDGLLTTVPLFMIIVFVMNVSALLLQNTESAVKNQQLFDKLVSAADYSVKVGLAKHDDAVRYPNLISQNPDAQYSEKLRKLLELSSLYISFEKPDARDYSICIYRLVVLDEPERPIRKLYVCGD